MKRLLALIVLIGLIAAVIGYAVYTDSDRYDQRLFHTSMQKAANVSQPLEEAYLLEQSLPMFNQEFELTFGSVNNGNNTIKLTLESNNNQLYFQFGEGDSLLSKQSIILEPQIIDKRVLWKCTGGSVLMRLRAKPCRIGQPLDLKQLNP